MSSSLTATATEKNRESVLQSYLPETTSTWEFRGQREYHPDWGPLGAEDGIIGQYLGPNRTSYEIVVMKMKPKYAAGTAESLACVGWQYVIEDADIVIAASTGTDQRTFTPEAPPTMTKSPVPGTLESVEELLAKSPKLTETKLREREVDCES